MVTIVTDSTADLSAQALQLGGILCVPSYIHCGSQTFRADQLDTPAMLDWVSGARQLPRTSEPAPEDFMRAYAQALAHSDEVVSLHISSKLSKTVASAQQAAAAFGGRVQVLDSPTGTYGLGFQVLRAAQMADERRSAAQIVEAVLDVQNAQFSRVALDTVEFLRMSGRVNNLTAFFGTLLKVKPILTFQGGLVESAGRARGMPRALTEITADFARYMTGTPGRVRVAFMYSPGGEALAGELRDTLMQWGITGFVDGGTHCFGTTITSVTGPGAVGMFAEPV